MFLAALGLHCFTWAFSSCSKGGPLSSYRVQASHCRGFLCWSMGSTALRFSSCGPWAQLLLGMWNLPEPGIEPLSSALAGGFLTTGPPGKPSVSVLPGVLLCYPELYLACDLVFITFFFGRIDDYCCLSQFFSFILKLHRQLLLKSRWLYSR